MDKEMLNFQKNALLGHVSGEPLCVDYKQAWRACGNDKEMLMKMALSQQALPFLSHACFNKLGLSKKYLMENFAEYINGRKTFEDADGVQGYTYQMYVGQESDFDISADVTAIMWTEASVNIHESKCPTIYVSNNSDVHITCEGCNSVRVYLFDQSSVTVDDSDETCNVIVYKYSNRAHVEVGKYCLGSVKEFNKQLRL